MQWYVLLHVSLIILQQSSVVRVYNARKNYTTLKFHQSSKILLFFFLWISSRSYYSVGVLVNLNLFNLSSKLNVPINFLELATAFFGRKIHCTSDYNENYAFFYISFVQQIITLVQKNRCRGDNCYKRFLRLPPEKIVYFSVNFFSLNFSWINF